MLDPWKESYGKPRQHNKKQRYHFANKGPYNQSYDFSSSHVRTWELDHKECWTLKNWCFWIVALEKTPDSPSDTKEIKPVNLKGNQPWIFVRRLVLKLRLQYSGHLMWRSNSLEKTLILGKTAGRKRRGWQRMRSLGDIINTMMGGREHSSAHQQIFGLKIYWAWPHLSEHDPVSPTVSISHQKASKILLSLSLREQTEWKQQSQKIKQTDHLDHSLV